MLYTLSEPFEKMLEQMPKIKGQIVEVVDDGLHALDRHRVAKLASVKASFDIDFSVHAPFAGVNIALMDKMLLGATLKRLKKSLVNAAALSCKMWVFHPGLRTGISMFYPGADWTRNLDSIRVLADSASEESVRISVENVMNPFLLVTVEEFKRFYGEAEENVGLALDTGHANLVGEVDAFVKELPSKLVHVHAHDNVGKHDQHLAIGYGSIDWRSFADLLKKNDFRGTVIVESVEHVNESVGKLKQLLL